MRVLVTGGCGYKGSVLVPKLIARGHHVRVFDVGWFGSNISAELGVQNGIEHFIGDLRDGVPDLKWAQAVIHLAGIANDPCGDLDARLTWDVNALATYRLGMDCVKAGVRRLIFASSGSVYGIKDNVPVDEDAPFEPVSDYNKTKMVAEKLLSTLPKDRILVQVARPATICGVSPRQRLDVIVNLLTAQAMESGVITAHCGAHGVELMRPHMHIDDVTDLYCWMLEHPEAVGPFNAASENQTVGQTAKIIADEIPGTQIEFTTTSDKRSYAVNFNRLLEAGFRPKKTVRHAIREMRDAWKIGKIKRSPSSVNLDWMRMNGWARAA